MILSIIIFFIGAYGFVINRNNIIIILLCIEIILLAITILILLYSYIFDDIQGQTFGILIIAVAGAESALGLGLLVAYYRIRGNINIY